MVNQLILTVVCVTSDISSVKRLITLMLFVRVCQEDQ